MAKSQLIPDEVRRLIAKVYIEHPGMPAKDVRKEVDALYRKDHPRTPKKWPGLSAVQKILHEVRSKHLPNPKDVPWSLYTLAEYDVPADALQAVMDAYAMTLTWDSQEGLTVREAQWVARLYRVIVDTEELSIVARECANNERVNEVTRYPSGSLVDADFEYRALFGKPGISYKYLGDGKFQMAIVSGLAEDLAERIACRSLPKRMSTQ
ncbi:hypothetical protein ACFLWB_02495 [Chloroflexota bacterium]